MLVPSEFSHLRKRSAKKLHFCTFPGFPSISESAKNLQKLFGSALSHLRFVVFLIFVRVIAREAPKTLKWPSDCAHLLVHLGAALFFEGLLSERARFPLWWGAGKQPISHNHQA